MITLVACAAALLSTAQADDLPLVLSEDFESGTDRWEPTDSKAWKLTGGPKGKVYSLTKKKSKYKPPHRSPYNISLLKDVTVGDFVLELDVLSTEKDYNHRSLCLFFGYQDPAHFYYVHFGKKTDDHANQIFIVNDKARTKISTKTSKGTPWDDKWHKLKIVRRVSDGTIETYFDDMKKPVMKASDKTFKWGQIGIGSFDDMGNFDNVKIRGIKVKPVKKKAKADKKKKKKAKPAEEK